MLLAGPATAGQAYGQTSAPSSGQSTAQPSDPRFFSLLEAGYAGVKAGDPNALVLLGAPGRLFQSAELHTGHAPVQPVRGLQQR